MTWSDDCKIPYILLFRCLVALARRGWDLVVVGCMIVIIWQTRQFYLISECGPTFSGKAYDIRTQVLGFSNYREYPCFSWASRPHNRKSKD